MTSSSDESGGHGADRLALSFAMLSMLVFIGTAVWVWLQTPDRIPSHYRRLKPPQ